ERTPLSEALRGLLAALQKLGLDIAHKALDPARKWSSQQDPTQYLDKVMEIANVDSITMTNPVFDDNERNRWLADRNVGADPRFKAVLRIDPLLCDWPAAASRMTEWGFACGQTIDDKTVESARRF